MLTYYTCSYLATSFIYISSTWLTIKIMCELRYGLLLCHTLCMCDNKVMNFWGLNIMQYTI